MSKLFVPLIVRTEGSKDRLHLKRELRDLFTHGLGETACAEAVSQYKSNGKVTGHKILDNHFAVTAFVANAPEYIRERFNAIDLTPWEQQQALDAALRRNFEMDKRGKLTGNLSRRLTQQK